MLPPPVRRTRVLVALLVASLAAAGTADEPQREAWDMAVYGGTSGGVVAAIQAARLGKAVVLLEPGRHLGGMTSGGLSAVDIGDPRTIGGIAREFFTRLVGRYGATLAWDRPHTAVGGSGTGGAYAIEPHVAEALFDEMAAEAGVTVRRETRLLAVTRAGPRITHVTVTGPAGERPVAARVFLDATGARPITPGAGSCSATTSTTTAACCTSSRPTPGCQAGCGPTCGGSGCHATSFPTRAAGRISSPSARAGG